MANIKLSHNEAVTLIRELELLGNTAHDAGLGTRNPVSGWVFAKVLHELDLHVNNENNWRDFGEDGGS